MSDCKCGDDASKFFSNLMSMCEDKEEGKHYQNSNGVCVEVEEVCENSILKKTYPDINCPKIEIENNNIKKVLSLFYFLCSNINISNNLVKGLVRGDLQSKYEEELLKLDSDIICDVGKAKILAKGIINVQLANIYNIFGLVLYNEFKNTEYYAIYLIDILADLECSVGQANFYFQDITSKYNIDKLTLEQVNDYNLDEFIKYIIISIKQVIEEINSKKEEILTIEFIEGDNIRDDGYNIKYHYYYLIKCLVINENIRMLINTEESIDPEILEKYREISEKDPDPDLDPDIFRKKYLKYKKKYTQLKASLIK